jgi:serine/threonine-protein kinase HipA
MNRCPISYELCGGQKYSIQGLKRISPALHSLQDLPYSAEEQRYEAALRADKMSIQGVQPKLSAILSVHEGKFNIVNQHGQYILKPPNLSYPEIPENEDLTMHLASLTGIEVPIHGLIYARDGTLTYFIKRFDRGSKKRKLPLEDFAQLSGENRETKYKSSMEKVGEIIEEFCTFPALEKTRLFKLTLFNYLIGNEDMHLKNFSLITRESIISLSPAYDLINTTIAVRNPKEELALPLLGKKSNFSAADFFDYYARERLSISARIIQRIRDDFKRSYKSWQEMIAISFLSDKMKVEYQNLIESRRKMLDL